MIILLTTRGSLRKKIGDWKKKEFEVPDNCTAREALIFLDLNPDKIPNFGMTVINGMKASLDDTLAPGDELKIWSKITGG